jgi:tetratricopeptide repeat protein 8
MGVNGPEVWNNIGLCCFYSSQYDMALGCFERALVLAGDEEMSDLWWV